METSGVREDEYHTVWPLIKYTKLIGHLSKRKESEGYKLFLMYNKHRSYITILGNSETLEEFSLYEGNRLTVKSREPDIFFEISSFGTTPLTRFRIKFASSTDHKIFVEFISYFTKVLPPSYLLTSPDAVSDFSQPQSQVCNDFRLSQGNSQFSMTSSETSSQTSSMSNTVPPETAYDCYSRQDPNYHISSFIGDTRQYKMSSLQKTGNKEQCPNEERTLQLTAIKHSPILSPFSQNTCANTTKYVKNSQLVEQAVPIVVDDVYADKSCIHVISEMQSDVVPNQHFVGKNVTSVGVQTEQCLSVNELLGDPSKLEKYLMEKLQDRQFMQLVEKCAEIYDANFARDRNLADKSRYEIATSGRRSQIKRIAED